MGFGHGDFVNNIRLRGQHQRKSFQFKSLRSERSRGCAHHAVIRVYDAAGNVIEDARAQRRFQRVVKLTISACQVRPDLDNEEVMLSFYPSPS
jgi:hypothetical protein